MRNKEKLNALKRAYRKKHRDEYFEGKCCTFCGSTDRLELDHVDPSSKSSHRIWTWSKHRRELELSKCRPLCHNCHVERHRLEMQRHGVGGYKRGCRCVLCVYAKKVENSKRKVRRKIKSGGIF